MRKISPIDALFAPSVQAILTALLVERTEPWYLSDLAKRTERTPSTLQRPLESLTEAGILKRSENGNRVYYERNQACPILPELQRLLIKSVAVVDIVRAALEPFASRIDAAFIYGSVARADERSESDIDVMVVGETSLAALTPSLTSIEEELSRPVNVVVLLPNEFRSKIANGNHFLQSVLAAEKIFVLGTDNDLERISQQRPSRRPRHKQGGAGRAARGRSKKS
jgi:predicted nucleotidyltransferase